MTQNAQREQKNGQKSAFWAAKRRLDLFEKG